MMSTDVCDNHFFAPTPDNMIEQMLGEYDAQRRTIEGFAEYMKNAERANVFFHFFKGNQTSWERNKSGHRLPDNIFSATGALKSLDAMYWNRLMEASQMLEIMPSKRRWDWHEKIREMEAPEFTSENVNATMRDLLSMRMTFFSEKVDGIFRGLSGTHLTNRPEGFSKRMIVDYFLSEWGTTTPKLDLLSDLRNVIAKFMGTPEKSRGSTYNAVQLLTKGGLSGEWIELDGGALRLRVYYQARTAHIEIHPDMAWRLNAILAHLHPTAIPSQFREKPKKPAKKITLISRQIPPAVMALLDAAKVYDSSIQLHSYGVDKHVIAEARAVLEGLGGYSNGDEFFFDYDIKKPFTLLLFSGIVPDDKSHQFYPTPDELALKAVEAAQIGDEDICLEPSAGLGSIAKHLPKDRTICVEVSDLRCAALEAKGYATTCGDFLKVCGDMPRYERIIMNPPFDRGQWQAHLEAAAGLLKQGGRLVSILPEGAQKKLPTVHDVTWEVLGVHHNMFSGTSISVCMVAGNKGAA